MKPRAFRAASTQSALEQVQNELGRDAIVVSVRQVPVGPAWQTWKRPEVEVLAVAALSDFDEMDSYLPDNIEGENDKIESRGKELSSIGTNKSDEHPALQASITTKKELESYLAQLTTKIAQAKAIERRTLNEKNKHISAPLAEEKINLIDNSVPKAVVDLNNYLDRQGLDRELVKRLITTSCNSLDQNGVQDEERLREYILHQLVAFTKPPKFEILKKTQSRRVLFIIGSSGSGKTSTCAKIAAYYRQIQHKEVAWICADTVRAGAIQLARSYTDSLGIPLRLAYTSEELKQYLENEIMAELILVDTPACNPYTKQDIVELGEFLSVTAERETYLTIAANTKEADMNEIVAGLSPFNLTGLIITKLDESGYFGGIFNLAWHSPTPVCAYTDGSDVLKNLHPAHNTDLARLIFGMGLKQ